MKFPLAARLLLRSSVSVSSSKCRQLGPRLYDLVRGVLLSQISGSSGLLRPKRRCHMLPKQFEEIFEAAGLDIEEFTGANSRV